MQTKTVHELKNEQAGGVKILTDTYVTKKGKEKERPWRSNKVLSSLLSASFIRLDELSKAYRVGKCGEFLEFKVFNDGAKQLKSANFCKCRLCPMCQWRRSRKVFRQVSRIMDYLEENKDYRYIFLTTTFRNMSGEELPKAVDSFMEAFNRMTKTKEFKKASKGFFRALEVRKKFEREDFHPHMHVIIAVDKRYFDKKEKDRGYMNHDEWMNLWRECARLDYDPWVDIRAVKPNVQELINEQTGSVEKEKSLGGAVAEISKYCTKATDIIHNPDSVYMGDETIAHFKKSSRKQDRELYEWTKKQCEEYTDKMVFVMDGALKGRRLISFGGIFREVHKLLNLDDPTDGDLINTDDQEEMREDLNFVLETYAWNSGYQNFVQFQADDGQAEIFNA